MGQLDRGLGRSVFGGDPAAYDAIRPDYPEAVYAILRERCGLGPGCRAPRRGEPSWRPPAPSPKIAERQFGGRVERNMVTSLHTARRL